LKVHVFYFSPTGGTEKIAKMIGECLEKSEGIVYHDITLKNEDIYNISREEAAMFCVPSYGGRVPSPCYERLSRIQGFNSPCTLIATFGNREIDDTLYELKDMVNESGFRVMGAAKFVTPHSIDKRFGAERPDVEDLVLLKHFAQEMAFRINNAGLEILVPGNSKYKNYDGVPCKPSVSSKCNGCGICVKNCPVGAISDSNPKQLNKNECISCMRCIKVCPQKARSIPTPTKLAAIAFMKNKCSERKSSQLYF